MKKGEKKEVNRKIVLLAVLVLMFLAILATQAVPSVRAETGTTSTSESPPLPEEPSFAKWFVDANGTVFQITSSSYLNVTLTSSEYVHVFLESVPRVVSYSIESLSPATSTVLTLSGFVPGTTYYRYQDGYHVEQFAPDSSGGYTYTQDISEPHHVYIQEYASTLYIGSDYTFTSNIYEPIVVVANNIVIDGNGYALQSPMGGGYGIYISGTNITIKNVKISRWQYGIFLGGPSNNISGNTITGNGKGIELTGMWNTILGNTITGNGNGIRIRWAGVNTISGNTITGNEYGIWLVPSDGNTIMGNTITDNWGRGIMLEGSAGNTISGNIVNTNTFGIQLSESAGNIISGNTVTNNWDYGILLSESGGNTISGNTVTNNMGYYGIFLDKSGGNTLRNNIMIGYWNLGVYGLDLSHFILDVDTSNTVNGKPTYYLINQDSLTINPSTHPNIGYLALVNSTNITVEGLELKNNRQGILLAFTTKSKITTNTITKNWHGIELHESDSNTISGNNITDNRIDGIRLSGSFGNTISDNTMTKNFGPGVWLSESSGNIVYHNNFIRNPWPAYDTNPAANYWSHPYFLEGNYWWDYPGVDDGSGTGKHAIWGDGIGDTNIPWHYDYYPFVQENGWTAITAHIYGTVTDEYTKQPIQEVTITILETGASTETDAEGKYDFTNIQAGSYTVEMTVPYGYLTHDSVTNFVEVSEGQYARGDFTLYQAAWSGATVPRTIGYWKNWENQYSRTQMETFVTYVKAASDLFSDLTVDNLQSYLNVTSQGTIEERGEAQLLTSWLNVVSAQLGLDVQVDITHIAGWQTVINDADGILTLNDLLKQIDNYYLTNAALTRDQWEIIKNILDSLNSAKLFVK